MWTEITMKPLRNYAAKLSNTRCWSRLWGILLLNTRKHFEDKMFKEETLWEPVRVGQ